MRAYRALAMQRPANREQALRISRLLCLIYRARFQRHRDGIRLISTRIIKLAVDQDRHWNQSGAPFAVELQNRHSSRLLTFLRLLVFL